MHTTYQEKRNAILSLFNNTLDERDTVVREPRISRNPETGIISAIGIIARKQPRYFYTGEIAQKHRLLIVKVATEAIYEGVPVFVTTEFPYSITDLEKMWELMFDVWVKEDKIIRYCKRFLNLIYKKLAQRKLENYAVAYFDEVLNKGPAGQQ